MTASEATAAPTSTLPTAGALSLGLLWSVPAALPALARVAPSAPVGLAAAALVGAVSLIVAPVGFWLRRAVERGMPRADRALSAGAALSALPLALLGGVLKSTTHHRPLGGVTFAVAASCLLGLCLGLAFRVFREPERGGVKSTWLNLFTLGCGLSLACAMVLGLARAARPSLVDFLALAAAVAVAGLVTPKPASALARLPLSVVFLAWLALLAGAAVALRSPELARSLTTQAPVSFVTLSWLGGGS